MFNKHTVSYRPSSHKAIGTGDQALKQCAPPCKSTGQLQAPVLANNIPTGKYNCPDLSSSEHTATIRDSLKSPGPQMSSGSSFQVTRKVKECKEMSFFSTTEDLCLVQSGHIVTSAPAETPQTWLKRPTAI
ncbi:hypothetical protein VTK73DRAFT_9493 [Phialemonium thermophilum]|uniref:Uncharacterized protein n=1 Tax=Phialemonium thermophilum TaxID=223376 RepID=A0ABR3Y4B4_9PEZI